MFWFTFTVKSLQKKVKPELNDKFVKENYSTEKLTTVSEYKVIKEEFKKQQDYERCLGIIC